MDTRKLSRTLIWGGIGIIVLAVIWFVTAYADAMSTIGDFGGGDVVGQMMSCLYSNPAICQGASFMSDGPSYTPAVFWIGVLALLAGLVMHFTLNKDNHTAAAPVGTAADGISVNGTAAPAAADGKLLGILAPEKYTRTAYILVLIGAVCLLIVPVLAIVGLAGFVLALLGMFTFKPRLTAHDGNHLTAIVLIFAASSLLLLMTAGSILYLLVALVQLVLFYIGFNSFRHGRSISAANIKDEAQFALKPLTKQPSKPDGGQ